MADSRCLGRGFRGEIKPPAQVAHHFLVLQRIVPVDCVKLAVLEGKIIRHLARRDIEQHGAFAFAFGKSQLVQRVLARHRMGAEHKEEDLVRIDGFDDHFLELFAALDTVYIHPALDPQFAVELVFDCLHCIKITTAVRYKYLVSHVC